MLLAIEGLAKRFGRNTVLRDVCCDVRAGEILGLIGPNGSGKTTLFECLAGLIPTDAGEVRFEGSPLAPSHRSHAFFYLPDGIHPWAEQPAGWVLRFFSALYGPSNAEYAAALQLDALSGTRVGALSKGETKRLLLALALTAPHPVLLLDEPFDGLDFRQTQEAMALLRTVSASGRTLFLSIHQLADAARICDRLVLLNRGEVAGQGTLDELRAKAGLPNAALEDVFVALT